MLQNKSLTWAGQNLAGLLALFFLLKDFFVLRYLSGHYASATAESIVKIGLLPGSLLFWRLGFAGWLLLPFNIVVGALVGWLISKAIKRACH